MRLPVLILLMCSFLALMSQAGFVAAASDAETVITECQKRTGMGRESCVAFIKKYMSVERCEQYTSFSALECAKKLEELRRTPEFQSSDPSGGTSTPSPAPVASPVPITPPAATGSLRERVLQVKRDKEARLRFVEEETSKIIRLLKEKGQDTTLVEERLRIFNEKGAAALTAYDQYASFAIDPAHPPLTEPRLLVRQVLNESADYYRTALLPALREALRKVTAAETL